MSGVIVCAKKPKGSSSVKPEKTNKKNTNMVYLLIDYEELNWDCFIRGTKCYHGIPVK